MEEVLSSGCGIAIADSKRKLCVPTFDTNTQTSSYQNSGENTRDGHMKCK